MTAPRIPLFQRKGAPAPAPDMPTPGDAPIVESVPATCPSCGCTFDPASGEVMEPPAELGDMGGAPVDPAPEVG